MDASSALSDSDDYDVVSNPGQRSLDSSIADLADAAASAHLHEGSSGNQSRRSAADEEYTMNGAVVTEPPALPEARAAYDTADFSADEIQTYVRHALGKTTGDVVGAGKESGGTVRSRAGPAQFVRAVKVYVDGAFDGFDLRDALLLRQAKLAFPAVHLVVGVFPDASYIGSPSTQPFTRSHIERCELVRHCRWVDSVLPDAPIPLTPDYLRVHSIDYVALEEGASVDPTFVRERLRGMDELKRLSKVIPIRRTIGLPAAAPTPRQPSSLPAPPPFFDARPLVDDMDTPFSNPPDPTPRANSFLPAYTPERGYLPEELPRLPRNSHNPNYLDAPGLVGYATSEPVDEASEEQVPCPSSACQCKPCRRSRKGSGGTKKGKEKEKEKSAKRSSRVVAAEALFRENPVM
ncbi:hypothetical protein HGRIS_004879 [Hohenbuehelia grisea]|uniref:choline-phosphate cytidylyltransferase n=1 Tax=Hohenbuehelia grisea TaxID=104357 RepID=A0ABR3JDI0_9AGAR